MCIDGGFLEVIHDASRLTLMLNKWQWRCRHERNEPWPHSDALIKNGWQHSAISDKYAIVLIKKHWSILGGVY